MRTNDPNDHRHPTTTRSESGAKRVHLFSINFLSNPGEPEETNDGFTIFAA